MFFINKITSKIRYCFFRKSFKSEGCEALCLPNLLAGGLLAGALAASIASQTLQTQNTHTHTRASNTTQHKETEPTMWGRSPPSLVLVFVCAVLCFSFKFIYLFKFCVCFVFEVCVGVVPRVCEAMEAASAPAGKPPAKRLGKQIYVSIKSIKLYHKSEHLWFHRTLFSRDV